MVFPGNLIEGILIKRYKRFLADIELPGGKIITAHTPNTGSMKGCCGPGSRVWVSDSGNPKRKFPLTWELIEVKPHILVGINTGLPNKLVKEAIENGNIKELQGYGNIRQEVSYGEENSRIDLLLTDHKLGSCYVEIKNVTLVERNIAYFPDAISKRGTKHLRELINEVKRGNRATIFYSVQREDVEEVRPANHIDPEYGETLRVAIESGVEAIAYGAKVSTTEIKLEKQLPVVTPGN